MRLIDADRARAEATIDLVVHYLDRQPTIDAVPVVHGRWLHDSLTGLEFCSECQMTAVEADTNYCPNCGARMEGE